MQELLTGVTFNLSQFLTTHVYHFFPHLVSPIILIISLLSNFLYFQGLNLLELATHHEEKAPQLRHEGLGQVKIALAGTDTSSLLEILQGHFGCIDSSESDESADESEKVLVKKEMAPEIVERISARPTKAGHLATAELVFPFKSSTLVVAGTPKMHLPLCGPETLSQYHCEVPLCTLEFAQKAAACNHVCHDHLNIALAC